MKLTYNGSRLGICSSSVGGRARLEIEAVAINQLTRIYVLIKGATGSMARQVKRYHVVHFTLRRYNATCTVCTEHIIIKLGQSTIMLQYLRRQCRLVQFF